jgi:hypothetical protein
MILETSSKELAKELAYEGLCVSKCLEGFLFSIIFLLWYAFPFDQWVKVTGWRVWRCCENCPTLVESDKPCFLTTYDDETRYPEEVCVRDLITLRSAVIRAGYQYQSACSRTCSRPWPRSSSSFYGEGSWYCNWWTLTGSEIIKKEPILKLECIFLMRARIKEEWCKWEGSHECRKKEEIFDSIYIPLRSTHQISRKRQRNSPESTSGKSIKMEAAPLIHKTVSIPYLLSGQMQKINEHAST